MKTVSDITRKLLILLIMFLYSVNCALFSVNCSAKKADHQGQLEFLAPIGK